MRVLTDLIGHTFLVATLMGVLGLMGAEVIRDKGQCRNILCLEVE